LLSALTLRTKKIYFEQVLHIVSLFCGKGVDWISKFDKQHDGTWLDVFRVIGLF